MATTFEHTIGAVDELIVRFTSTMIHPDAGIAWSWHHAAHALARIEPLDQNPIAIHLGDDLFDDQALERRYPEVYADVAQLPRGKKSFETTVFFTEAKWIPSAIAVGFTWQSSA
jgi:hypothetical protein